MSFLICFIAYFISWFFLLALFVCSASLPSLYADCFSKHHSLLNPTWRYKVPLYTPPLFQNHYRKDYYSCFNECRTIFCMCFFKARLKKITGHRLIGKGLSWQWKRCPFHLSLKLKWSSANTLRKDIKLQILQFCCASNFPMLLVRSWEGP